MKPILFNSEMIRAVLDGRKTQTRRVCTVPWAKGKRCQPYDPYWAVEDGKLFGADKYGDFHEKDSPYGKVGDKLWVRETFYHVEQELEYVDIGVGGAMVPVAELQAELFIYRADDPECGLKWKPSIFMPRVASRITLEITAIRAEKAKDMTEGDVIAEGIEAPPMIRTREQVEALWLDWQTLWDSINKKRGYSWESNPYVWVVEFEKI